MTNYNGPERRETIILDHEAKKQLAEIHVLMTDKDVGICARLKRHDEIIHGNGKVGLKTQVFVLWLVAGGLATITIGIVIKVIAG